MNFQRRQILHCLGLAVLAGSTCGPLTAQRLPDDSPRMRWFESHKDSYDILFFGSSRILHGISPKLFDQVAAESGRRWRGFNFGVDKMRTAGSLALLRKIIALQPAKVRYVFFELQTGLKPGATGRDPEETEMPVAAAPGRAPGPDGDGFIPLQRNMKPQTRPIYEQRLQMAKQQTAPRSVSPATRDALSELVQELAAKKIQVVFVVAPSLRAARGGGVNTPPGILLFSFDDLARYAPLYDERNRPDAEHLNARGAEIFTRELAQQFVHALDSTGR